MSVGEFLDWVPVELSVLERLGRPLSDALSTLVDVSLPDLSMFLSRYNAGRYGKPSDSWRLVFDGASPEPWSSHVLVFCAPSGDADWQLTTLTEQIDGGWTALLNTGPVVLRSESNR